MADDAPGGELQHADIVRILQLLPHRPPFLLIDRIIEMDRDLSGTGIKSVSMNEPFFAGHFPGRPVMPGVLIVEAMAQTAGALVVNHQGRELEGSLVYFMTIEKARFRKPVVPGDTLYLRVERLQQRSRVWRYGCQARVDGTLVTEAEISAMLVPPQA